MGTDGRVAAQAADHRPEHDEAQRVGLLRLCAPRRCRAARGVLRRVVRAREPRDGDERVALSPQDPRDHPRHLPRSRAPRAPQGGEAWRLVCVAALVRRRRRRVRGPRQGLPDPTRRPLDQDRRGGLRRRLAAPRRRRAPSKAPGTRIVVRVVPRRESARSLRVLGARPRPPEPLSCVGVSRDVGRQAPREARQRKSRLWRRGPRRLLCHAPASVP